MQILGIFIGFCAGLTWEILSTTPFKNSQTLVPSLIVKQSQQTLHIHHWLIYVIVLISLGIVSYKTNRLSHPAVLFLLSFLIAALAYNFWRYPDWYKFIK